MFYYVYVLQSEYAKELYIGYTADLPKRVKEHNQGVSISTKRYMPWKLIHYESFLNEADAMRRERYLKTNQGCRLLQRMLKEYLYVKGRNASRTFTTRGPGKLYET
ncbi:MAG: hypothetical protein UX65_C0002G0033 [Parcubacteria group bacterium GW2011_GWB1_46_8]|nr:MAG: hypothetical protein UX14_C0004G0024 [Parcubacteria group bacterium GW2011_GWF1_45_5]KKU11556.1 MAG: hypothetical protein UX15_C0002G0009 [Parcubacteria group bacterium GW2011_GWA1_45_7]KKU44367.1 MAG: hypothetical protein UX61_C0002G0010 [Parcubacteria group bacterium GW2011_GWA2_46_7]KKU46559.1 MAG: hypothetical protein UX65_C0002G0033 [Parcubacteria group bacterium GW2011_GWB1_46_8]KKU48004.1 MAG: hypothetical protein UX66_C0001G0023 [Parcubacteria group bacterium GW2011_GWF2_46_8]